VLTATTRVPETL